MDTEDRTPGIFSVSRGKGGWQFSRRGFILTAGAAAAGAALACGKDRVEPDTVPEVIVTDVPATIFSPTLTPIPTETPPPTLTTQEIANYDRMSACASIRAHTDLVVAMAFTPAGDQLLTAEYNGVVKVWSMPDGQLLRAITEPSDTIGVVGEGFALAPNGESFLLIGYDNFAYLYSLETLEMLREIDLNLGGITTVSQAAITPDGKTLIVKSENGQICLWTLPEGEILRAFDAGMTYQSNFSLSPDGTLLATELSATGGIGLYSIPTGELLKTLELSSIVHSLVFSPDGKTLFAGLDNSVSAFSIPDGTLIADLSEGTYTVECMAVSPDGALLAHSTPGDIRLLSLPDGELVTTLVGDISKTPSMILFSPDGTRLYVSAGYGGIDVWSIEAGEYETCLVDIAVVDSSAEVVQYEVTAESGEVVTYTVPMGSVLPAGAVCVCNVVTGTYCSCVGHTGGSGGSHYWFPN